MAEIDELEVCPFCGREKAEWISVKDELPEIGKRVLVYKKNKYIEVGWHREGIDGVHSFGLDYGYALMDDVTHWMPLPEPPEGE